MFSPNANPRTETKRAPVASWSTCLAISETGRTGERLPAARKSLDRGQLPSGGRIVETELNRQIGLIFGHRDQDPSPEVLS